MTPLSIAAVSAARGFAQAPTQPEKPAAPAPAEKPAVKATRLNQMTLSVTDLKRSIEFYQGLFGMPIYTREAASVRLRVGPGPRSLELVESKTAKPSITQFGMAVDKFDARAVAKQLEDLGVKHAGAGAAPLTSWTKSRGETAELFLADPDGLVIQLQDASYCGGAGALGNRCALDVPLKRGPMRLSDLSHFTIRVADAQRSRDFYEHTFGMAIQAYQGENSPILGIGTSKHFVMSISPRSAPPGKAPPAPRPAAIDHGCFLMEAFDVDRIMKVMDGYGMKARGPAAGPAGPLVYYVSNRGEERGGAPGGTPEFYFTDPDGILLQLQDLSYCGGGGTLGSVCP